MLEKKELTLKKSVGAIQSKPDSALTLLDRKLFNICLYHAYNDLKAKDEHRLHIDLLHDYLGYKGNNWTKINNSFDKLQSTKVSWNIFGQSITSSEEAFWTRSQMIGVVKWSKETKEFIYTFSKELAQALYRPDQYAIIFLRIQQRFKSEHTLVIYEQCIRYKTNVNGTRWFTIQEIKDLLVLDSKSYDEFKILNNRVLKPVMKEINSVSDVCVHMEFKKQGRAVTAVKFFVIPKAEYNQTSSIDTQSNSQQPSNETNVELQDKIITAFKIKKEIAEDLLKKYAHERIVSAIQYVLEKMKKRNNTITNPAAYFIDTLKNDYKTAKQVVDEERNIKRNLELKIAEAKSAINFAEKEYSIYEEKFIYTSIYALNNEEQKALMMNYDQYLKVINPSSKFKSNIGLGNLIQNKSFKAFAKKNIFDIDKSLLSFDEYIRTNNPQAMDAFIFLKEIQDM